MVFGHTLQSMKLKLFCILLSLCLTCIFAQNEYKQANNGEHEQNLSSEMLDDTNEGVNSEVDFSESDQIYSNDDVDLKPDSVEAVVQNRNIGEYLIETDSKEVQEEGFEQKYNIENDETTGAVNTEEIYGDEVLKNEVYDTKDVVETDREESQGQIQRKQVRNIENTEHNVDYNQVRTKKVIKLDNNDNVGVEAVKTLPQSEFASEILENNMDYNRDETDQSLGPTPENAADINGDNTPTDHTKNLPQDNEKQNYNENKLENDVVRSSGQKEQYFTEMDKQNEADINKHARFEPNMAQDNVQQQYNQEQLFSEVIPKYDVDTNEYDTGHSIAVTEVSSDNYGGSDSIEVFGLPETLLTPNLRSTISCRTAGPRILVVDIFTVSVDEVKSIFHTEWTEVLHYDGKMKAKVLRVTLPDNLVYKEDKILNIFPDLHSESLLVRVSVFDYTDPSSLLLYADRSIKLIPPWSRLPKYSRSSCNSWIGMLFKHLTKNVIPKCPMIDDIVELLSFPVPLVASEYGYKKFFERLREPEELLNRPPQFTLATWLYLTKRCTKDMCPLLYRMKGSAFQTPLIGLLKTGHLHLQFHYEDGSGYAFLVDAQLPVHRWVHITVTVKHTVVSVYVRYGNNLQHVKTYVHSDFPAGLYHYNDTDGYWGLGGSPGFASTYGFIGPTRIYRRHVLSRETIDKIFTASSRPDLGFVKHFKSCRKLKAAVKVAFRKESMAKRQCSSRNWLNHKNISYCDVDASGLATEVVRTLIDTLSINETYSRSMIQQEVYRYAFNVTKSNKNNVKDALPLLSYSSCLGHPQSFYLLSVLYITGLGITVNRNMSKRLLLLGSFYNHPLSQMSLAYKHYIGVDGFPRDYDVASTFYRYAAVQSNRVLAEHNEVDTHSEAVRLDKKEDLENYRGPDSNWFSWLKHQAKRGVTDAQSALGEMFYYGSRGLRRNLTKAAEFYKMGANDKNAQMLFNLGVVKLRGQGVDVDTEEAQNLLKKSAELGFAPAYNALGYYELNVRQNNSGAFEYFRFAAEQEDRDGMYNFGFALENGLSPGTVGDLKLAMPYYINSANKGHTGACVVAGDAFSLGQYVERQIKTSIIFYKFVADQIPEVGLHLRSGLDCYFEKAWYQSFLHYLLAAEAGMEIAQYNTALLCEWELASRHTQVDCTWRYYNHSAKLEWVPSLIKTGDNHWYGITAEKNITTAAQLYSQAATKEQNPQAIYNLAYLVENSYSLDGLNWLQFNLDNVNPGNLSLAAVLYRKCRDTSDEALIPCSFGLLRVALKMALQLHFVKSEILLIPLALFLVGLALLHYLCRITSDYQMIELA